VTGYAINNKDINVVKKLKVVNVTESYRGVLFTVTRTKSQFTDC